MTRLALSRRAAAMLAFRLSLAALFGETALAQPQDRGIGSSAMKPTGVKPARGPTWPAQL